MADDENRAVIETDFFNRLTEQNQNGDLFLEIISELNKKPVMHEYVYRYELNGNITAKQLIDDGKIDIITYDEYINENNRNHYETTFRRLYRVFNHQDLSLGNMNIYTYHHEKENLGEIRAAIMALYLDIDLLLSNDGGAKSYIASYLCSTRHQVKVLNVFDTLSFIAEKDDKKLQWKNVKGLAKRVLSDLQYEKLNGIWHER